MLGEPDTQRVVLGLQSPLHSPSAQRLVHAGCAWFSPIALQRSGVLPSPQLRSPGMQEPVHAVVPPLPVHAY
jgi:hypothetical protein